MQMLCNQCEQAAKNAVEIWLTLLHLGVKDIRLGPTLPQFISPNVFQVLVDTFDIKPIAATAKEDLDAILGVLTA